MSLCVVSAVVEKPDKERVEVKVDSHTGTNVINLESTSREQMVRCCLCWTVAHLRQALWGVTVVLCVSSSWMGSTQLAKLTLRQLNVPFTLTWFSTAWNCLLFPLYYLGHLCWSKERQSIGQCFRWALTDNLTKSWQSYLWLREKTKRRSGSCPFFKYLFHFDKVKSWKGFKGLFLGTNKDWLVLTVYNTDVMWIHAEWQSVFFCVCMYINTGSAVSFWVMMDCHWKHCCQ